MLAPALDRRAGGITTVVDAVSEALDNAGQEVGKFAPCGSATGLWDQAGDLVSRVRAFTPRVVHTHGMWVTHSLAGKILGEKHGFPEMISPHGMLDAWALRNRAWKKALVWQLFEKRHLQRATVLHALCESEQRAIRAKGIRTPVALIPNGVNLPVGNISARPVWADVFDESAKVLLFLGRIHPKKGLGELIEAWAAMPKIVIAANWRLVIVGWDDGGHLDGYNRAIVDRGISTTCRICGPAFGEVKAATLQHAAGFVLPSFSEGLPMGVLEAWANRLPVLMTPECNLPEGFSAGAAFQIGTKPTELAAQLAEILAGPEGKLQHAGEMGRQLVEKRFNWTQVARQFGEVYEWMLGSAPRPDFVTDF